MEVMFIIFNRVRRTFNSLTHNTRLQNVFNVVDGVELCVKRFEIKTLILRENGQSKGRRYKRGTDTKS